MTKFLLILFAFACFAQNAVIRLDDGVFRVVGWTPQGNSESVLQIYAGEGDVPPLLGSYAVESNTLTFRPRFPLAPGLKLRAVFRPPSGAPVTTTFDIPKAAPRSPSTRVSHVYPSTDFLPENQLKFYIYFSASMQKGDSWSHIRLLDAAGKPVDLPFVEIDQELWDRENRRLTILFDPGRIKRGVLPQREVGTSIENGKSYTLVIDRAWLDGNGVPLVEEFRKSFRVGPSDREPIDTAKWKITAPRAGTADPLTIDFPESLDYALLQHFLRIEGMAGTISVDRNETQWKFTPAKPWASSEYKIVVQITLEDLAGNKIGRAFDVDIFEKVTPTVRRETVSLAFRPRR